MLLTDELTASHKEYLNPQYKDVDDEELDSLLSGITINESDHLS